MSTPNAGPAASSVEESSRALVTASVETCLCCRTGIFAPTAQRLSSFSLNRRELRPGPGRDQRARRNRQSTGVTSEAVTGNASYAGSDRVAERRRAVALARHSREAEGLSTAQIADRLGRSPTTVEAYFYDPTGEKAQAVIARYVDVLLRLRRRGTRVATAPGASGRRSTRSPSTSTTVGDTPLAPVRCSARSKTPPSSSARSSWSRRRELAVA